MIWQVAHEVTTRIDLSRHGALGAIFPDTVFVIGVIVVNRNCGSCAALGIVAIGQICCAQIDPSFGEAFRSSPVLQTCTIPGLHRL